MKFKVGDIIKGLPARRYAVTDEDMTKAEVISATDEDMRIKILEHNRINAEIGEEYTVANSGKYFALADKTSTNSTMEKSKKTVELPEKWIFNGKATILLFKDGTKTVVKRTESDEYNPRLAFLTAFFQHYCGMTKNKANKYLANLETVEANGESIIVKVTDCGKTYSTYKKFMNICFPEYEKNWKNNESPKEGKEYKLIGKRKHEVFNELVALIQDKKTKQVYLIGEKGIKEVKKNAKD